MALAYAHGATDIPLRGDTIGQAIEAVTARQPAREALVAVHQGIRWTYAELDAEVARLANGLVDLGVQRGDRVGLWIPNCAEWIVVQLASARIGAVLVTVNPAYQTKELTHALAVSGCRVVIAAPGMADRDYVAMLDVVRADLPVLDHVVILGTEPWRRLASTEDAAVVQQRQAAETALDADDAINIQFTSGTTGLPKGATLSHHNIVNNAWFTGRHLGYSPADRVCVPVPLYHCFGMVLGSLAPLLHGACVVLPGSRFEPEAVLSAVAAERCTSLYGVPTMFVGELGLPDLEAYDLSSLRTGIIGGAPCPVELLKQITTRMHMSEVTIAYGMTETSPVSTQTARDDSLDHRVSTVGRVHPHVEVKITDPATGRTVADGVEGELCTRGYSVMRGYWGDPDHTSQVIDEARWMHTGDLATMDAVGYVRIVGRVKDMIIRGGENISPAEIEALLFEHPAITDVQVVGIPDPIYGEAVVACVQVRDGAEVVEAALASWCRDRIARFKVPEHFLLCTEFPMTVTGKVQKFRLRELAAERLARTEAV